MRVGLVERRERVVPVETPTSLERDATPVVDPEEHLEVVPADAREVTLSVPEVLVSTPEVPGHRGRILPGLVVDGRQHAFGEGLRLRAGRPRGTRLVEEQAAHQRERREHEHEDRRPLREALHEALHRIMSASSPLTPNRNV